MSGLFDGLFGGLFSGIGNAIGAKAQADAAKESAQIESQAQERIAAENAASAKYAADLASTANANALNFSKAGGENAFQNNEVSRAGNYDQWAAAQRRIGSVAKLLGFGDREIPTYRPGVDPNFTGTGGGAPASALTATLPSSYGNLSDPSAWMGLVSNPTQLSAFVKSVAPNMDPNLVGYYVQKIQGQPGANPTEQAGSAQYWANKIVNDPTLGGRVSTQPVAPPVSVASFLGPSTTAPGLTAPVNPYAMSQYLS